MKIIIVLAAIAAMATAAEEAAKEVVVKSAPAAGIPVVPGLVKSAPLAYINGLPVVQGLSQTFPTLYTGAQYPFIYPGFNPSFLPTTTIYSGNSISPLVYTAGVSPTGVVSPAIVPKYFKENAGARHIVNY